MRPSEPIPMHAKFDDPVFRAPFAEMASFLVLIEAKSKIIQRFTGFREKAVKELYKIHNGHDAPAGRLRQRQPRHYALPQYSECKHYEGGRGTHALALQSACWCNIFRKIESAVGKPVNRGWLMAAAFEAYTNLTNMLTAQNPKFARITINDCYDLMSHIGYEQTRKLAPLACMICNDCGISYLIVKDLKRDKCPFCAMQRNYEKKVQIVKENRIRRQRTDLLSISA